MRHLICTVLVFFSLTMAAQQPLLEQRVTISGQNKEVSKWMEELEQLLHFHFSYKTDLIQLDRKVSISSKSRSLREVLFVIFPAGVQWKERGNYIILSKAKSNKDVIVSGYVEDTNGQRVKGATVYDSRSLTSANSNEYGYYEMRIERSNQPLQLEVRKSSFNDTISPIIPSSGGLQNITVSEKKDTLGLITWEEIGDSLKANFDSVRKDIRLWTNEVFNNRSELVNVNDTLYRTFQVSLVPFVGSNHRMSGHVINDLSLNILGGYSLGTRAIEIAGVFNTVRGDVAGVQIAGFANANGGKQEGLQIAGFTNLSGGDQLGMQIAGFANVGTGKAKGFRIAGFSNLATQGSDGFSIAGFSNIDIRAARGMSIAGFSNVVTNTFDGMQIAGFANVVTDTSDAMQIAGFANVVTNQSNGMQIAGFANFVSHTHKGMQISGFLNLADTLVGMQIGVINLSRTIKGLPIGVLSFAKNGYWGVDFGYNDTGFGELQFRTGVKAFYNIFSGEMMASGIPSHYDPMRWSMGYGAGTYIPFGKGARLNLEISDHHISEGKIYNHLSLDQRLLLAVEVNITKHLMIYAGPQFHSYATEKAFGAPYDYAEKGFVEVNDWSTDKLLFENWVGWKGGIRIARN